MNIWNNTPKITTTYDIFYPLENSHSVSRAHIKTVDHLFKFHEKETIARPKSEHKCLFIRAYTYKA